MNILHCVWSLKDVEQYLENGLCELSRRSTHTHDILCYNEIDVSSVNLPESVDVKQFDPEQRAERTYNCILEADVVHLHSTNNKPYYRDLCYLADKPVLDQPHRIMEIPDTHRTDTISCVSKAHALKQTCPPVIRLNYPGISSQADVDNGLSAFDSDQDPVLVEDNRSTSNKRFKATDIVPEFIDEFPDLTCHVLGESGPDQKGIQYHPDEPPDSYYQRAQFLIHHTQLEHTGYPVLKAYQSGTIPVASGDGCLNELIINKQSGFWNEEPSKQDVIKQLKEILGQFRDQPDFWKPMAEAGINQGQSQFSLDDHVKRTDQTYGAINGDNRSRSGSLDWSQEFQRHYNLQAGVGLDATGTGPQPDAQEHAHERDWVRLNRAEDLFGTDPGGAIELVSSMEGSHWDDSYKTSVIKAEAYRRKEDFKQTIEHFRQAIEHYPKDVKPYLGAAEALIKQQNNTEAYELLEQYQQYETELNQPTADYRNKLRPLINR